MTVKPLDPCEIRNNTLTAEAVALEVQRTGPPAKTSARPDHPMTRCGAVTTAP